jgi:hypothetical protein
MLVQDDPRYDNDHPETYPWDRVKNAEVREWAASVLKTLSHPFSLANHADWPSIAEGLRMSLRIMARYTAAPSR